MPTIDQHLQELNAELGKLKTQLTADGSKLQSVATDGVARLRARAAVASKELNAATHAGLSKFEAELAEVEAKAKAALAKARGSASS